MATDRVLLTREDDLAIITLSRPEAHNALDLEMVQALHRTLDELEGDRELGAVILTGAGERAFAAGADIAQLLERGAFEALAGINSRLFRRIELLPVPTIAAIRGFALGGGCELALACDLRVAGESARLGQPEVTLGIIPGAGATQRLPHLIGLGRAKEMIFTGRIMGAEEALRIGLLNRVVPDDQVLDCAMKLAREILQQGRLALRIAKLALHAAAPTTEAGLALESAGQALLFESTEKKERMTRFLDEKRDRERGNT
jgi:enoyl-CoA hydratase/carnithine racemase